MAATRTPRETAQEPEPAVERWVFGGIRVSQGGKRVHEWVDPNRNRLLFKAAGSFSIGSIYDVRVLRGDNTVSMYGRPTYTGDRSDDHDLIDQLSARHRAAGVSLGLAAQERTDRRQDPVDRAVDRLVELATHVPASQRLGFALYVANKLLRS